MILRGLAFYTILISFTTIGIEAQNPACCSCNEALYHITFQGIWSPQTHPRNYPTNQWLLHWSDIIGASHTPDYRMWKLGTLASSGLKILAEFGITKKLENELKINARYMRTILKMKGLYPPNVEGQVNGTIRVDKYRHLLSFGSMLGPSPDWFVGLDSFDLCMAANCTWSSEVVINLRPLDAGTDDGPSYESRDEPSIPARPIKQLSRIDPPTNQSPWFDSEIYKKVNNPALSLNRGLTNKVIPVEETLIKPVARIYLKRIKIYETGCDNKGYTKFLNDYKTPNPTSIDGSPNELENLDDEETRNLMRKKLLMMTTNVNVNDPCAVTIWSGWTACSASCGTGTTMRQRFLIGMAKGGTNCENIILIEKAPCVADIQDCQSIHPKCRMTIWTAWTPCSAKCGKGMRFRTRGYDNEAAAAMMGCSYSLMEKEVCMENTDCDNALDRRCQTTVWSSWSDCSVSCGIAGIRYRSRYYVTPKLAKRTCYEDLIEKESCKSLDNPNCEDAIKSNRIGTAHANETSTITRVDKDDIKSVESELIFSIDRCRLSLWSEWSPCTASCGTGTRVRTRYFIAEFKSNTKVIYDQMMQGVKKYDTLIQKFCTANKSDVAQGTHIVESEPCQGINPDCAMNTSMSSRICYYPPERGMCRGNFERWYYNSMLKECRKFWYSGCRGGPNNFRAYIDCKQMCLSPMKNFPETHKSSHPAQLEKSRDCMMSEWTPWSLCSKPCGKGMKSRQRMIKVEAENGGLPCPNDAFEFEYCFEKPCNNDNNCLYGPWSEWTSCLTCESAVNQTRERPILQKYLPNHLAVGGGSECDIIREERECSRSYACTKNYASA